MFVFFVLLAGWAAAEGAVGTEVGQPQAHWLYTDEGQVRGMVLESELPRDAKAWELWGSRGPQPLAVLESLMPEAARERGMAVNGGYWNELNYPVGVTAGEQGIFAARSHPYVLAIGEERAWLGAMQAEVRLRRADEPSTGGRTLALNPQPLPRRNAYLIDPWCWPYEANVGLLTALGRLRRVDEGALRFNEPTRLVLEKVQRFEPAQRATLPLETGDLLWVAPEAAADVDWQQKTEYVLEARLRPVTGRVQLATSAGPMLMEGGKVTEGLDPRQAWRTAVGIDESGTRLWVVVLARSRNGHFGLSLGETAQELKALGAWQAMNLDGGSSTSLMLPGAWQRVLTLFPLQRPIHHGLWLGRTVEIE